MEGDKWNMGDRGARGEGARESRGQERDLSEGRKREHKLNISNSVLTKAYIKFRRSRPHQCLTQERLRFETFYKITQKHFNGDQFYQRVKKNEY